MHVTCPPPQDESGLPKGGEVIRGMAGVPQGDFPCREPQPSPGVLPQVLIREEHDPRMLLEGPAEDRLGTGGGTAGPAFFPHERLHLGGGVHVGHREELSVHVHHLREPFPGIAELDGVGLMGEEAACVLPGDEHLLAGSGEDRRGLGHEVDPAEHDAPSSGTCRPLCELQGVAAEVGVVHDLVPLVVMGEDEKVLPELLKISEG